MWKFKTYKNIWGYWTANATKTIGNTLYLVERQAVSLELPITNPNNTEAKALQNLCKVLKNYHV